MIKVRTLMDRYNVCLFAFQILGLKNKFWGARFIAIHEIKLLADSFSNINVYNINRN